MRGHWAVRLVLAALLAALAIASLLPLVETDLWWIRYLDFPRLQIALALLAALVGFVLLRGRGLGTAGGALVGLAAVALGYQVYKLHPYTPLLPEMATSVAECAPDARLRVMVANVQRSNERADALFALVADADPDLLLLLETDAWWDERLGALGALPHRVQSIPQDALYFGIHLLSRHPLVDPQVMFYFGADTPSIVAGIELPGGGAVDFIGLHPRPPQSWGQPTTMRDAHLYAAATAAAASAAPSIVAGDFNAAPWERATRRAMRLGGLLDPRVGRGLFPSYDTHSLVMSWPIDQVLFEPGLGLVDFRKLPSFGADHYPILADLCLVAPAQSAPAPRRRDAREAETAMEAAQRLGN